MTAMPQSIDAAALRQQIDLFEQRHAELSPLETERDLVHILKPLFEADGYSLAHTGGPHDGGVD
jgi:hypothetical protein